MSSAPTFLFSPGWSAEESVVDTTSSSSLGDGYSTDSPGSLQSQTTWNLTRNGLRRAELDPIIEQLQLWGGVTSFRWSPHPDVPVREYFTDKWTVVPEGFDAWQLSLVLTEDITGECLAFAALIPEADILNKLIGASAFLNSFTSNTGNYLINSTTNLIRRTLHTHSEQIPATYGRLYDQLSLALGCISTYELTNDEIWLTRAVSYANAIAEHYYSSPTQAVSTSSISLRYGQLRLGASVDAPQVPAATIGVQYGQLRLGVDTQVPQAINTTIGMRYESLRLGASSFVTPTPNTTVGIQYGQLRLGASATVTPNVAVGVQYGQLRLGASVDTPQPTLDKTGLLAWYTFNTNLFSDSSPNNRDWTVNGTELTLEAGKVNTCANKPSLSSTDFLSQPSSRLDEFFSGTFYVSAWIKRTAATNWRVMEAGAVNTNAGRWHIQWFGGGNFDFNVRRINGNSSVQVPDTTAIDEFIFCEVFYNAATNGIGVAVNRGPFVTTTMPSPMSNISTTGQFILFRSNAPGQADELTIWSTLPDDDRRDYLWNDGNGNTYPT